MVIDLKNKLLERIKKDENILLNFNNNLCIITSSDMKYEFNFSLLKLKIENNYFYVKYKIEKDDYEFEIKII